MSTLTLDGTSLSVEDLHPLFRGEDLALELAPSALERVHASRRMVEEVVQEGRAVYGLTTASGS